MKRSFFWDKIAKRYSKQPVADEAAYQKKLEATRDYLSPEMELLEFGCGTGSTAITLAPYVKHIHAIDISSKMIEIAQGKAAAKDIGNITFKQSTIDDYNAGAGAMDAVLGHSILHLLDNWQEVISKVYDMLNPGGVFVTSTACIADEMKYFKYIAPIGRLLGLTLQVFTSQELEDALTAAGFEISRQWRPGAGKSVFIVAKKAAAATELPK